MDEIKKFLRLMEKEALVDLAASMMFQNLVTATNLAKDLLRLEGKEAKSESTKSM